MKRRQGHQYYHSFFHGRPGQAVFSISIAAAIIFGVFELLRPNYVFLPSLWIFGGAIILMLAGIAVQRKSFRAAAIFSCVMVGLLLVWVSIQSYIPEGVAFADCHYCVLVGAVNQVLHGKSVLIDVLSQYGTLYPYAAILWMKLTSCSVNSLSLFFTLLILLSWTCIGLVLWQSLRSPVMMLITLAAVLGFSHGWETPYYQYLPLRVVCGALFILAVYFYAYYPRAIFFLIASFVAAFGLLWNLDTGIIILGAWLSLLAFNILFLEGPDEWLKKGSRYISKCLPTVFFTLLIFAGYDYLVKWRSGSFVEWTNLFHFQKIFYGGGILMLPMPQWDFWVLPVIIYSGALLYVFDRLRIKSESRAKLYFALSIYGIGLLTYYQGRSNITCLAMTIYPSVMLAGLLLQDIFQSLKEKRFLKDGQVFGVIIATGLFLYLGLGVSFLMNRLPGSFRYVQDQVLSVRNLPIYADNLPEKQVEQFIAQNPDTLLLKHGGEYIYYQAHQPMPIPFCSPYEIILKKDVEGIQREMDKGRITHLIVHDDMITLARELSLGQYRLDARIGLYSIYTRQSRPADI